MIGMEALEEAFIGNLNCFAFETYYALKLNIKSSHRLVCIVLVSQSKVGGLDQVQIFVDVVQQILPSCFALKYDRL